MRRIIIIVAGICVAVIFYMLVSCITQIRKEWWRRILLLAGCWILIYMIIYTGDLDNLPPTLLFFLVCVWNACCGSGLKRLTIGMMLASVMLALNALFDNSIVFFCIIQWVNDIRTPFCFVRCL